MHCNNQSSFSRQQLFFSHFNQGNSPQFDDQMMQALNKLQEHRVAKMKNRASLHKLTDLQQNQLVLVKKSKLELNPVEGLRGLLPSSKEVFRILHVTDMFVRIKNVVDGAEYSVQRNKIKPIDFDTMLNLQLPSDQFLTLFKQNKYINHNKR